MKKLEKIALLSSGIGKEVIVRMYFRRIPYYFYYYVHAVSDRLVLGQEEYDFQLNGYHVRKLSQLTKAEIKDDLCPKINIWNGVVKGLKAPIVDITSWRSLLSSPILQNRFVIIEDEANDQFDIGLITKALSRHVRFLHFGSDGVFDEEEIEIPYSTITHVSWGTRYAEQWYSYMEAHGMLPAVGNAHEAADNAGKNCSAALCKPQIT